MTNGTASGDADSLPELVEDLLLGAIRGAFDLLGVENALDHLPAAARTFEPGDRTDGSAALGDASGVVELDAQFEGATPPNLRWALDVPYRVATAVLEADSNAPSVDLYAGAPGVHELRLEEVDGDDAHARGRTFVSVPWFVEVTVADSFDDVVPNTGMDRDRLLRRSRTVADYLLRFANVRTVWTDGPFAETLPPQFRPAAQQPTTGSFLVTGRPDVRTELEGAARDDLIAVELKGSHTVEVGELASGASLYVGDVTPENGTPFETILEESIDDLRLEEELTARYLGIEVANHVLSGMGVPPADGALAQLLGDLTIPDLHLRDDRHFVEWYLLGLRIHSPEAFPRDISYLDRVRTERETSGLPLDDDQYGLPKPPYTPLDVLVSAGAESRDAIERAAPLTAPVDAPERDADEVVHRVVDPRAILRDPTDDYDRITPPATGAPQDEQDRYQSFLSRPHVSLHATHNELVVDQWAEVLVVERFEHEDRGELARVATTDGDAIGWTVTDPNLAWFVKDNDPGVALAPDDPAAPANPDTFERQIRTIYNRVGGLFAHLSDEFGIDVELPMAFYRNEGGSCDLSHRDEPMLRFENHVFWRRWGDENSQHTQQYDRYFDHGPADNWRDHRFCASGNCPPDDWEALHSDPVCSDAFQDLQHDALTQAAAIADRDTAIEAASVGYPQVMGGNHAEIGYASPSDMYDAFAADERAQVFALFDYLRRRELGGETGIELAQLGQGETRDDAYWSDLGEMYNGEDEDPVERSNWSNSGIPPTYASGLAVGYDAGTTVLAATGTGGSGGGTGDGGSGGGTGGGTGGAGGFTLSDSVGDGGTNDPADVLALKQRLVDLGFDWLDPTDDTVTAALEDTIDLVQSIKNGRSTVRGDARVDVPGDTYSWLRATNAPEWQLLPLGGDGDGFENYERQDPNDDHDYGTNWMAETIAGAGEHYRDTYLDDPDDPHPDAALLTVNDVSRPQGGDTPDHAGHETGMACDLRLPRTDGHAGGIEHTSASYDRDAMRAMLEAVHAQPLVDDVYFNDPTLITENLCDQLGGHDDHVHFGIQPPTRNMP